MPVISYITTGSFCLGGKASLSNVAKSRIFMFRKVGVCLPVCPAFQGLPV